SDGHRVEDVAVQQNSRKTQSQDIPPLRDVSSFVHTNRWEGARLGSGASFVDCKSAQLLSRGSIELQKPGFPRHPSRVVEQPHNSASAKEARDTSAAAVRVGLARRAGM